MTVETFSSNGNWVAPDDVTSVDVNLAAPGGSGHADGGGGGGGARSLKTIAVIPGTSYPYAVNAGADATFNTTSVVAKKGASATGATGAAGGAAAAGTGTTKYSGGAGADFGALGGGGGEGASSDGDGADAVDEVGGSGGSDGGKGGDATDDGTAPGGGGGGSSDGGTHPAGAGAAGSLALTYTAETGLTIKGNVVGFLGRMAGTSGKFDAVVPAPGTSYALLVTGIDLRHRAGSKIAIYEDDGVTETIIAQDKPGSSGKWRARGTKLLLGRNKSLGIKSLSSGHRLYGQIQVEIVRAA